MAAVAAAVSPPRIMFSQRGSTCGPDSLFTILFESDGLRDEFAPYLEGYMNVASSSPLHHALALAIQRYRKMKTAGWTWSEEEPFRRKSANEGEGAEALRILSECDPHINIGMKPGTLKQLTHTIIESDALDIPLSSKFHVASLPGTAPAIDTNNIIAILLEFDQYVNTEDVYSSVNDGEILTNDYAENRLDKKRKHRSAGHITAFLKHAGEWYYADNIVGWLHKIRVPEYVENNIIPIILSGGSIQLGVTRDESQISDDLYLAIAANGKVYIGTPELLDDSDGPDSVIDWSAYHFGLAEAHIFAYKKMGGGGSKKTRKQRRRKHRKRQTNKASRIVSS